MTTYYSRSRNVSTSNDPYLHPQSHGRSRSLSSSRASSPHSFQSFQSNAAIVDGPAPSGNYYGVYLGEPPAGFPASPSSSAHGSQISSSAGHYSLGTSNGSPLHTDVARSSEYRSTKHASHSSIAFPVSVPAQPKVTTLPSRSRRKSVAASVEPVERPSQAGSSASKRASILPEPVSVPLPRSALKRERRSTLSPSGSTDPESSAPSDLRSMCKFAIGSIAECMRRPSNSPLIYRLKKIDGILGRMFTALLAISSKSELLSESDAIEFTRLLQQFHNLLYRALSSRTQCQVDPQELDGFYSKLRNASDRLELALEIDDLACQANQLTFRHNLSQDYTRDKHEETHQLRLSLHPGSSKTERAEVRAREAELAEMHRERVQIRQELAQIKQQFSEAKRTRDALAGAKSVRFM